MSYIHHHILIYHTPKGNINRIDRKQMIPCNNIWLVGFTYRNLRFDLSSIQVL